MESARDRLQLWTAHLLSDQLLERSAGDHVDLRVGEHFEDPVGPLLLDQSPLRMAPLRLRGRLATLPGIDA